LRVKFCQGYFLTFLNFAHRVSPCYARLSPVRSGSSGNAFSNFRELLYTFSPHPIPIVVLSLPQLFHRPELSSLLPVTFSSQMVSGNHQVLSSAGIFTSRTGSRLIFPVSQALPRYGTELIRGCYHGKVSMNKKLAGLFLFTVITASTSAQTAAPAITVARWPQDRVAAISLTFDDGINTHLDFVGPILKKHHLNGTFFVATGMGPWEKRKPEWKQLAEQGNELANHTVHHPCLLAQIKPHSQDYTPAMMEAEIGDAAQQITQLFNSHRGLTFAYPCGNMSFGKPQDEAANAALYLRYVSENSIGARGAGAGSPQDPDQLNVLDVGDLGPTADKSSIALLAMAQPALQGRLWGVYCFHGVGGDWLSITPETLDELAGYLERHSEIWTATFGDAIRYTQERKALSIQVTQSDATSLAIALQWPMAKQIYDLPLTLKVELPEAWAEVTASGDGNRLAARIVDRTKGTTLLVEVPAQTRSLHIASAGH
jgi:peptidoglycan/xylan/chitin deacetylase (PgdA/CDA1 family)